MKCPICDGMGTSNTCVNGTFKPCSFCDGTGEVMTTWEEIRDEIVSGMLADGQPLENVISKLDEMKNPKPMTNEEWFCTLSTEEKAKVIVNIHNLANIEQIEWWLKEKHE